MRVPSGWIAEVSGRARREGTLRALTPDRDREVLAGPAASGTEIGWLDGVQRDLVERAGDGGQEMPTWVAAWRRGRSRPRHRRTISGNGGFGGGQAVAGSSWAFAEASAPA